MGMITKDAIYQRLDTVIDPETNLSVVAMGLIYEVRVIPAPSTANGHTLITIRYTLTTPGCPLAGTLQQMIREALRDLAVGATSTDLAAGLEEGVATGGTSTDLVDGLEEGVATGGTSTDLAAGLDSGVATKNSRDPNESEAPFDPDHDLVLELTFDPPWHLDLMSEEARAELGF